MTAPVTRLGLQISGFSLDAPDSRIFALVSEAARVAEKVGFDSLWTTDHVHQVPSVGERDDPVLEAYTTLAALAPVTERVRLGALVTCVGFRRPALLAKMVSTIDIISGGRAVLGIGAGWLEEEHRAYGIPFPSIGGRLEELEDAVRICRAMFTSDRPSIEGKHYSIDEPFNMPAPLAPGGPPILIGGSGERVLIPMVARLADACNFFGAPATVEHKIAVLNRACAKIGRDPASITKTWLGAALVEESEQTLQPALEETARRLGVQPTAARGLSLSGTPSEVADQVRAYRAAGIDGIIVSLRGRYDFDRLERVGTVLREAVDE
jgi:F420-dependent oxidoreductase-like protein